MNVGDRVVSKLTKTIYVIQGVKLNGACLIGNTWFDADIVEVYFESI